MAFFVRSLRNAFSVDVATKCSLHRWKAKETIQIVVVVTLYYSSRPQSSEAVRARRAHLREKLRGRLASKAGGPRKCEHCGRKMGGRAWKRRAGSGWRGGTKPTPIGRAGAGLEL